MSRDEIDPEAILSSAHDIAGLMAGGGSVVLPPGMPETMTAMFLVFADIRNSDCVCEYCCRIREITHVMESL